MRLFRRRVETRQTSYTDTLVNLLVQQAGGSTVKTTATAALQAASGLIARAFAAADVQGPPMVTNALTSSMLSLIGRGLIRGGEVVLGVEMLGGRLQFLPAADWDVRGGPNPDSWSYRLNLPGPDRQVYRVAPGASVLHFTYERDASRPWEGVSPLQSAALAGKLSSELQAALADEASGTRGHLLPIPTDGDDPTVLSLKTDIRTLNGQVALVESAEFGQWPADRQASSSGDWMPRRLGANPPAPLVELHAQICREVLMCCGISPNLFDGTGTASREAWRQFLHGSVAPLGRQVAAEVSEKSGMPISLEWSELRASDISGRARAFQSMVNGGMETSRAAELAGLD